MEEGPSSSSPAEELSDDTQESVFSRLKPHCVELLDLLRSPKKAAPFLPDMASLLRRAPGYLLQPCFDYTLFPLLLLLDAAVQCRSQQKVSSEGTGVYVDAPLKGLAISDSVAEGVLMCLEELLKKCYLGSVDQMVVVLKKLTLGALLSPSEAAEEFREGVIRCLRMLLLRLEPCSSESCTCRQVFISPTFISSGSLQAHVSSPSKYHMKSEECLLDFLRSQNASAAVGHWLSLLLQTAEAEAARGLRGSAKLRKEAFLTLQVFVAKVGTADALAFFLPGVVSHFSKALYVTKSMISGAAGSIGSIDHAIRGLTEFLVIVLRDEANLCGLEVPINNSNGFCLNKDKSSQFVLEALRHLPINAHVQDESSRELTNDQSVGASSSKREKSIVSGQSMRSLYVHRTKAWIEETSLHVDKLLSAIFPHLCVHPAEKIRQGLVAGIRGILLNCCQTLKNSKLMLLECLCVLVCDDSEVVSVDAQEALESLFMLSGQYFTESEVAEIFSRLIERLPKVVFGSEESIAVSHAQKLLALMYYVGPEDVVNHLLHSPVKSARFLEFLGLSLSQNSLFSGSVNKLILSKPLSVGYLHSVAELKAVNLLGSDHSTISAAPSIVVSPISFIQDEDAQNPSKVASYHDELPRMPPWFVHVGSQKLYAALAGILRLLGSAVMADHRSDASLSVIIDTPLDHFRKLISEIRMKEYSKESWQCWYARSGTGQLLRQASTAACMLNEIMYGISDQSTNLYTKLFGRSKAKQQQRKPAADAFINLGDPGKKEHVWKTHQDAKEHVLYCVGSILHEYISPEVWDLPIDQKSTSLLQDAEAEGLSLHFFRDVTMLHQVIIDGIGIFNISLGKDFVRSGFMHASLYLLLQNLICSNNQIRRASDAVLHVVSTASGHPTVGHLVVANADYIIDSLCRQLRHLDLHPHIPDVLAAMLSYVGAAHEILSLLEEPMRTVSLELEVLGRHQHPGLTVPFLKAVREIVKSSRREACKLPSEAELFYKHVKFRFHNMENRECENCSESTPSHVSSHGQEKVSSNSHKIELQLEHWEELLVRLNEMRRYRHIVGSVAESCIKTAIPLLASLKESSCLVALEIVEDGIAILAKVEETCKHEKETKDMIEKAIRLCSFQDLQDIVDAADEGIVENRLLPAMNKIWPYLILCLKNRTSVAVIRRCMSVLSGAVQICGGDFFVRRFRNDGSVIWKLLATSPFQRRPLPSRDERRILLSYRNTSLTSEDTMAETSSLKIQAAALNMIAEISRNKRSAAAVEAVLKKASGLAVGIACSSVTGLRDASVKALSGLACIDPDLIWLLLADVYYSLKHKDVPRPPALDLAEISQLLPPALLSKEYLYIQYGGESSGYDVDPSSVEIVFQRMQSEAFT